MTDKALGIDVPEEKRRMVGYGSMAEVLDASKARSRAGTTSPAGGSRPPTSMSART